MVNYQTKEFLDHSRQRTIASTKESLIGLSVKYLEKHFRIIFRGYPPLLFCRILFLLFDQTNTLVMDSLNTHDVGSLYEMFVPDKAKEI